MISKEHKLPTYRQCQLLEISRTGIYYRPVGIRDYDLMLMRLIDEIHLKWPFFGSSVKYEEVYLKAYGSLTEARIELMKYFEFYNGHRRHMSLGRKTPDAVYRAALPAREAA